MLLTSRNDANSQGVRNIFQLMASIMPPIHLVWENRSTKSLSISRIKGSFQILCLFQHLHPAKGSQAKALQLLDETSWDVFSAAQGMGFMQGSYTVTLIIIDL